MKDNQTLSSFLRKHLPVYYEIRRQYVKALLDSDNFKAKTEELLERKKYYKDTKGRMSYKERKIYKDNLDMLQSSLGVKEQIKQFENQMIDEKREEILNMPYDGKSYYSMYLIRSLGEFLGIDIIERLASKATKE